MEELYDPCVFVPVYSCQFCRKQLTKKQCIARSYRARDGRNIFCSVKCNAQYKKRIAKVKKCDFCGNNNRRLRKGLCDWCYKDASTFSTREEAELNNVRKQLKKLIVKTKKEGYGATENS